MGSSQSRRRKKMKRKLNSNMGRRRPTVPILHKNGFQHREHRAKVSRKVNLIGWKMEHNKKTTKIKELKLKEIENEIINQGREKYNGDEIRNN